MVTPDFLVRDPNVPRGGVRGPEGFKEFVSMYRGAFPDLHMEIRDQVAEGDAVGTRFVATGTHEGI